MECPHCSYQHGFVEVGEDIEIIKGDHGNFWDLCVKMKKIDLWEVREATLRGCPKCLKTFIGDD